ncbi:granulocyte colony-stimulating factor receptor [Mugil cephalus]|uniref:granulocyte colony-stimulating factor receptor n=1 Tax=Mugil cephalus TaxID=48193 RepID=UPI001FB7F980|nr:granulocyte colony-stimulating factor receptor [Mugil cephalus]XP_047455671.1 granulocyte colony-stimulating factor receptor [Mugil cephalus]
MISTVIVVLLAFVSEAKNEDDIQPCAKVQTSSSVVLLGSPVTATCVVRGDCPLVAGQAVHIEWRLGNRFIPSNSTVNGSDTVSEAVISNFNQTRELLTCYIQNPTPQAVAGVVIRAGYPPEAPQNLSCLTNLTKPNTMTCSWDPGQRETHLLTNYSLHTNIWDLNINRVYELPSGIHHYTIPRSGFSLSAEMKIQVKAVNELGEASSGALILEPLGATKFDPPEILNMEAVAKKYGCLRLRWSMSKDQAWIQDSLNLQVRFKTVDSSQWSEQIFESRVRAVNLCQLLHGTQYLAQIRVRYKQSPWSDWSGSQSGVTLETAPTGRLDWWMKVSGDQMPKQLNVQLFWKPSKQFRANGQNVSYIVTAQKTPGEKGKLCFTRESYCSLRVPGRAKKVYLRAVNAAGKSPPTEVRIYQPKAYTAVSEVTAVPYDDTSLLVWWKSGVTPGLIGYVVEWIPLLETGPSHSQFEIADKNQSSLVITGSFEPYKPYGISVYPRFKDGIGLPQTVNAYLRQKAPSMVPKMKMKKSWKPYIEVTWDEIPLDQRNGFIQNYQIFYWEEEGPINIVNADPDERKVTLKNINTMHLYKAFMMVSTSGGSINGSTFEFQFESFDAVTVEFIATGAGGLIFVMIIVIFLVLTCFSKQKRIKGHFWPAVPDPANSSVKRWTSESTQDSYPSWDNEEPNPIYLSHLSFLDLPMKSDKEEDDLWLNNAEDTSDLGESICGSPFIPGYSGSNSDSIPYATVIFSSPCNSPPPKEPHVYLRSESTQPLLEAEEPFSPKCYQNMTPVGMSGEQCLFGPSHDGVPEEGPDPVALWDDFPFLRALAMNDTQND